MTRIRRRYLPLLIASFSMMAACGGGSTPHPVDQNAGLVSQLPTRTMNLPLQHSAPPVGGDVQTPVRDIVRRELTDQDAQEIANACRDASEVTPTGRCAEVMRRLIVSFPVGFSATETPDANMSNRCQRELCLAISEYRRQNNTRESVVEIVDRRPGRPLCATGPDGLCFVLPADTAAAASLADAAAAQSPVPSASATSQPSPTATLPSPSRTVPSSGPTSSVTESPAPPAAPTESRTPT